MTGLLERGQLEVYLQQPVSPEAEDVAIRVAEGWLRSVTRSLPTWPQPVPEDLWAWALELAGIAYTNPAGLSMRTVGDDSRGWAVTRRREILEAAAQAYGAVIPQYSFPDPPCPGTGAGGSLYWDRRDYPL